MNFPLFLVPMLVGLITQGSKPLLNRQWYAHPHRENRVLPRYGGMPSTHTSFAFSLATVVAVSEGVFSASFAVVAAIVIFILDDALRMRIFLGRHGQALRQLIHKLPEDERKRYPYLETQLGHKTEEVIVGAILGVVLTLVFMFFIGY
jgi:acid phosphatase family membrane protein YuiD